MMVRQYGHTTAAQSLQAIGASLPDFVQLPLYIDILFTYGDARESTNCECRVGLNLIVEWFVLPVVAQPTLPMYSTVLTLVAFV